MTHYSPKSYFDLTQFAHADLFTGCTLVWETLDQIRSYLEHQQLSTIAGEVSSDAYLIDSHLISIGEGTVVEPGAYIQGPCIIGKNCYIRHGAYLRGNIITGDGVVIGHATEVKNSLFLDGAKAPHFNYVGDSILGSGVNLGAGTSLANFRLDGQVVTLKLDGELVSTGRRKFGAIIGDGASVGCNCVTNPGTLIGKGQTVLPCTSVKGIIECQEARQT